MNNSIYIFDNLDEVKSVSCSVVSNSLQPHGIYSPWNSPGQNTGVGSLSLLQGIIPTQESNPGLPHYRRILYQLIHKGSPRILESVVLTTKRHLPRAWPMSEQQRHLPSASTEIEPHAAIAADLQQPLRQFMVE